MFICFLKRQHDSLRDYSSTTSPAFPGLTEVIQIDCACCSSMICLLFRVVETRHVFQARSKRPILGGWTQWCEALEG